MEIRFFHSRNGDDKDPYCFDTFGAKWYNHNKQYGLVYKISPEISDDEVKKTQQIWSKRISSFSWLLEFSIWLRPRFIGRAITDLVLPPPRIYGTR